MRFYLSIYFCPPISKHHRLHATVAAITIIARYRSFLQNLKNADSFVFWKFHIKNVEIHFRNNLVCHEDVLFIFIFYEVISLHANRIIHAIDISHSWIRMIEKKNLSIFIHVTTLPRIGLPTVDHLQSYGFRTLKTHRTFNMQRVHNTSSRVYRPFNKLRTVYWVSHRHAFYRQ